MAGTKTQVQTGTGVQDYETSFGKGRSPTFLNMYGAASGNDTTDVLDKIISGQLSAKESYLPRLKALALQKEAERQETVRQEMQKTLLAEQAKVQAEGGAISNAVKAGAMMLDKMPNPLSTKQPTAQTSPGTPQPVANTPAATTVNEVTPTPVQVAAEPVPAPPEMFSPAVAEVSSATTPSATVNTDVGGASPEGQIQEAKDMAITKETAQEQGELLQNLKGHEINADATSKQIEAKIAKIQDADSAHEAKKEAEGLDPLINKLDVIKGVGTQRVRDLKELGKGALGAVLGGFNLATTLAGGLENLDALDIANTGVGAAGTVGNLAKAGGELLNNQALANLGNTIGAGVGKVAPVLGLASGVQGIAEDPSNPVGYTNTAMAALNAVPLAVEAAGAAGAATGAGTSLGAASSAASAVALPIALIAAGEAGRGAFGGPGKTWDEKNKSEKLWDNPGMTTLNPGYVIGSGAMNTPVGKAINTGYVVGTGDLIGGGLMASGGAMKDFAKFSGAAERISMAPIDWLFSGNIASTKDAWYDMADIFGW